MERLPNRYPKISQSHKVPLYKGLSLFYPKLLKISAITTINANYTAETDQTSLGNTTMLQSPIHAPKSEPEERVIMRCCNL